MHRKGFYEKYIKRPQDFFCAFMAILVLSPIMVIVALLVRIKLGSPVVFKQRRPGLNEMVFCLYKFRTMAEIRDQNGELLPDHIRLTKFGRRLRSSSLDELPELFNVLKGDMAIIGPRPLLMQYLPLYNANQRRRHEVRPGLSGLAQINGRNLISWEERFQLDVAYIDRISFASDWKIVFHTLLKVLKREGISSSTSETMEEFKGNMGTKK